MAAGGCALGAVLMVIGVSTSKSSLNAIAVIGVFVEAVFLVALSSALRASNQPALNSDNANR